MVKVIVLEPGGRHRIEQAATLEEFQALVGGNIEHTPLRDLPGCDELHLWSNDDAIGLDLDPNLWSLALGTPFLGPLVVFREQGHDCKVDITGTDQELIASIQEALHKQLVHLGLYPPEPQMRVVDWPESPRDLE
jgi:hypothetical protein